MVANFKLTKNVILFLNGGIDMRKKSFIKIMISLCMIIMLVVPFKTSAKSNRSGFGDDSISLIGMCPYCPVSSFTVLECNKKRVMAQENVIIRAVVQLNTIFQHIEDIFVHNVKCVSMIR